MHPVHHAPSPPVNPRLVRGGFLCLHFHPLTPSLTPAPAQHSPGKSAAGKGVPTLPWERRVRGGKAGY